MTTQNAHLGAAIRRMRQRTGYSLRQLATNIGVTPSHLSMIESGQRSGANRNLLAAIARHVGCTITDLIGKPDIDSTDPAVRQVLTHVPDIRQALCDRDYDELGIASHRTPDEIDALIDSLIIANDCADYATVAAAASDLLLDTHALSRSGRDLHGNQAYCMAALLVAPLLRRFGFPTLHWVAAIRANKAARRLEGADEALIAHTWWTRAHQAMCVGSFDRARELAIHGLKHVGESESGQAIASRLLMLLAEIRAGMGPGYDDAVTGYVSSAQAAGRQCGGLRHVVRGLVYCGPVDIALWQMSLELDRPRSDPQRALGIADEVEPLLGEVPARRAVYFWVDRARALLRVKDFHGCTQALLAAELLAPQHVHTSTAAKETLRIALDKAARQVWGEPVQALGRRLGVLSGGMPYPAAGDDE